MNLPQRQAAPQVSRWENYRNNLPRHLIGIARHLQSHLMHSLIEDYGHQGLRLHFEPYITLSSGDGIRLSELAERLCISKQAVNQTVNQIEQAGYLERAAAPGDGRAKIVILTAQGRQLVADGAKLLADVEQEFSNLIGATQLQAFESLLGQLYSSMDYPRPTIAQGATSLGWLLPNLSTQLMQQLMELTRTRGHPGLKMSFGQVLTLMTPEGGRIQEMARINEVSKQAIGAIANELQALGYLQRTADPLDARQIILNLTPLGARLIEDSIASVAELQTQFEVRLGTQKLDAITRASARLYQGLGLGRELANGYEQQTDDLRLLAGQLKRELGDARAKALAKLLSKDFSPTNTRNST